MLVCLRSGSTDVAPLPMTQCEGLNTDSNIMHVCYCYVYIYAWLGYIISLGFLIWMCNLFIGAIFVVVC